jgi:hypothetical protein
MGSKPKTKDTLYAPEADAILRGQSRNANRIEHLLDSLLGFAFDADILRLFKKVCRYYYEVNPQATAFYVHAYREMWGNG